MGNTHSLLVDGTVLTENTFCQLDLPRFHPAHYLMLATGAYNEIQSVFQ